jgi:excinuclease ABC subunit C
MDKIKEKLTLLPEVPGCYFMKDEKGKIIYVGKAKSLKSRVKSYFTGSHNTKTIKLVSEIRDFEYMITDSEVEALILENNLIKKHSPKYNILLKDDKHYPYIKITNEDHPRILIVRKVEKDGAKYFGPYPNGHAASEVKKILDREYPLRKCDVLPKKECLYFHLGQCLAPCIKHVTKQQNKELVDEITNVLKGDIRNLKEKLKTKMTLASEKLDFEQAKDYRDQIQYLEKLNEKQIIDQKDLKDRDVFGWYVEDGHISVQVFYIRNGNIIERETEIFDLHEEEQEAIFSFIGQFYETRIKPKEIFLPGGLDNELLKEFVGTKILSPQRGDKKKLVELANKNARITLKQKQFLLTKKEDKTENVLKTLGEMLNIPYPKRIEMIDNSNIQGADPVSGLVVFVNGRPEKNEYRKFKIKTVEGPDDYSSMKEVVLRRYDRQSKEGKELPDILFVDGGKGQMTAAKRALDELKVNIPVVGIVKDDNHKTSHLLYGSPEAEYNIKSKKDLFYLIERIQDEVHRFAITFHRQLRGKNTLKSKLDDIQGIGEKRKKLLYQHFKTMDEMKNATIEEFKMIGIPEHVAKQIVKKLKE